MTPRSQTGLAAEARNNGATPAASRIVRQAGYEARLTLANGEQLLLTIVLPVLALFAVVRLTWIPLPSGVARVDVAVPGVLAVAIMSTAFTSQAIATAFDRRQGVLRLLGTTPLGRGGLIAGRFGAVLAVVLIQTIVLGGLGVVLGWRPDLAGLVPALVVSGLGCLAFLALGLLLGGTVRAEGVLAIANLGWLLLTGLGGLLLPAPATGPLSWVVTALPSGALGEGLRTALLDGLWPVGSLLTLLGWAIVLVIATRRFFRWG